MPRAITTFMIIIVDKRQKEATAYIAVVDAAGHIGVSPRTITRRMAAAGWWEDSEYIIVRPQHIKSPRKKNDTSFGNQY